MTLPKLYLCDKKPGACRGWSLGWTKCMNEMCNYTTNANHAKEKPGKWIEIEDNDYSGGGYWMCPECSHRFSFGGFNLLNHYGFCPNCGCPIKKEGGDS